MEKINFLKNLPLFSNLNEKEIKLILDFFNFYEKTFEKNNFIFEIGKLIDKIGIIISGEINIIKENFYMCLHLWDLLFL